MSRRLPTVITDVQVQPAASSLPARQPGLLPALRADLAPLLPTMRLAVTVVAAAAVADWALRTGTRAVVQEGLSVLGLSVLGRGTPATAAAPRSETLIVERVILHRSL